MLAALQMVQSARNQPGRSLAVLCPAAAVCLLLLCFVAPSAAQAGKRLILKDGSWQEVLQYEVAGDRTRYYSTLRREWEETPTELVDWPATEKWNLQPMQEPPEEETAAGGSHTDELTVAPGLQLPASGGVFILDSFSGGPSLVELVQVLAALNHNASGIFRSDSGPRAPIRQLLKLRGPSARTQAHVPQPQIFVKLEMPSRPQQPIAFADRFQIVKLVPEKDSRVLGSVKNTLTRRQSEQRQLVPARLETFHGNWLKIVPLEELAPGEYALVEMLGNGQLNSYVWDFGVDPHAPGNINARKPYSEATVDEREVFTPELKERKK